jgi:hypothetical protein
MLDQQREALLAAGIEPERIDEDTISGVRIRSDVPALTPPCVRP